MNYQEIINKLKENLTIEAFARNEFLPSTFTEEELKKDDERNDFCRDFKNLDNKSEEYKAKLQAYYKMPSKYTLGAERLTKELGLGKIEEIEQYGGEGMGDNWHSVKFFPDHNIYIKVNGWYASYDGTSFGDWDSACEEVEPKQVTKTEYVKVTI